MATTHRILQIRMSSYRGPADKRSTVEAAVDLLEQVGNSKEFRESVEAERGYKYHEGLTQPKSTIA